MRTLTPILSLAMALLASSCAMFGDLEGRHPFESDCPAACPADADGACQCVVEDGQTNAVTNNGTPNNATTNNAATNNATTNNGTVTPTNNQDPCKPDGATCCEGSAGGVDTCCDMADDPNCDSANNGNPTIADFSLAIVDASLQCGSGFGDGADILSVEVLVNGRAIPIEVLAFQPGPGAVQWSVDQIQAMLSRGATDPIGMCEGDNGGSVGLGCEGGLLLGFEDLAGSSTTDLLTVRIWAVGPQCDGGLDSYDVYACPGRDFQLDVADGCFMLASGIFGPWERSGRLSDFLGP